MQTLNAIANEDYYNNATTSQDSWHCAAEASSSQMMPSTGTQESLQTCSDRSLTTSNNHSPMLSVEDFFPNLDAAHNPTPDLPSTQNNVTPDSISDTSARKRSAGSPSSSERSPNEQGCKVQKRRRNTEAARRYRQRKVDRVSELEEALQLMTKERDEMKLRLARSEAEADVLRGLVGRRD